MVILFFLGMVCYSQNSYANTLIIEERSPIVKESGEGTVVDTIVVRTPLTKVKLDALLYKARGTDGVTCFEYTHAKEHMSDDSAKNISILLEKCKNLKDLTLVGSNRRLIRGLDTLTKLTRLKLKSFCGVDMITSIIKANPALVELSLVSCDLDAKLLSLLGAFTNLTQLKFSHIRDISSIISIIKASPALVELSLINCELDSNQLQKVAAALGEHKNLAKLELISNVVDEASIRIIATILDSHPNLRSLVLSDVNPLLHLPRGQTVTLWPIIDSLAKRYTEVVNFSYAGIGDEDAKKIFRLVADGKITKELDLCHNLITDKGIIELPGLLAGNPELSILGLRNNSGVTPAGIGKIFQSLSNNTNLRVISFSLPGEDIAEPTDLTSFIENNVSLEIIDLPRTNKKNHLKRIINRNRILSELKKRIVKPQVLALLSGQHPRTGKESPLMELPLEVVKSIGEMVLNKKSLFEMLKQDNVAEQLAYLPEEVRKLIKDFRILQHDINPFSIKLAQSESSVEVLQPQPKRRRIEYAPQKGTAPIAPLFFQAYQLPQQYEMNKSGMAQKIQQINEHIRQTDERVFQLQVMAADTEMRIVPYQTSNYIVERDNLTYVERLHLPQGFQQEMLGEQQNLINKLNYINEAWKLAAETYEKQLQLRATYHLLQQKIERLPQLQSSLALDMQQQQECVGTIPQLCKKTCEQRNELNKSIQAELDLLNSQQEPIIGSRILQEQIVTRQCSIQCPIYLGQLNLTANATATYDDSHNLIGDSSTGDNGSGGPPTDSAPASDYAPPTTWSTGDKSTVDEVTYETSDPDVTYAALDKLCQCANNGDIYQDNNSYLKVKRKNIMGSIYCLFIL